MASAREAAMLTLAACGRQGAWSDGYLKKTLREQGLDRRDAALAARLCYGVLQNKLLLDWHLARFCRCKLTSLDVNVLCNLRVAAYQILLLDKIPPSAAVNEAVELTKKHCRNPRAAGMVNGILRAMLRENEHPEPDVCDKVEYLSLRYSHPRWLVEAFARRLSLEEAEQLLAVNNEQPSTVAQINAVRFTAEHVWGALLAEGVDAEFHPWMPDCLLLSGTGSLERLCTFQNGAFYIQDTAAQLAVTAAGVTPGSRVLDACAAPGGKSFAAAIDMRGRGEIVSCDIHPHKIKLIETGRDRLGLSIIAPQLQSAAEFREDWADAFDTVIADVPCSGLGIIRKKPDIRFKDPEALKGLPKVQRGILDNCSRYVRPGGVLLYSTCTLLRRENEDVVEAFLAENPQFELEPFELPKFDLQPGMMTLWPHIHGTDGFFIARLRRKGGSAI